MSSPQPTVDPIKNASQWHTFKLKGKTSPGTIPRGGVKGFQRKTGWDVKKGKGTEGATLTLTTREPVKGSFTLQLFTTQDFANWDAFASEVLAIDPALQQAQGLSIYYPAFGAIALTNVVVESYTSPEHMGKGMYHVEIHLIEWASPPPANITSTPSTTAPDEAEDGTKPQVDPRVAARLKRVELLTQSAKSP